MAREIRPQDTTRASAYELKVGESFCHRLRYCLRLRYRYRFYPPLRRFAPRLFESRC